MQLSVETFLKNYSLLLVQTFALLTAIISISVNFRTQKKNRDINTVIQLTKDFYQNHDFTRDRLKLWVKFERLKNTDFKFDCKKILESIENNNGTGEFDQEEIIALNRTIAFYHTIKQLIKKKEVILKR